jgi:hypothetical protein
MNRQHSRAFAGFVLLMLWSLLTWAAATVTSSIGSVEVVPAQGKAAKLVTGERIESGATIKTGENSSAVLRFDDGQAIALISNTTFVVNDYRFNPHKPEEGGFFSTLVRGAVRAVTGIIGETNKENVAIKTPTATMGIRGTDFNLHFDGKLYLQVMEGAVSATNDGGVAIFDAAGKPLAVVDSIGDIARAIDPAEVPPGALASFRQLSAVPITGRERKPKDDDPTCRDRR